MLDQPQTSAFHTSSTSATHHESQNKPLERLTSALCCVSAASNRCLRRVKWPLTFDPICWMSHLKHTYTQSIPLPMLFPECPLSLGSFDCIDCNEFSVHTMNINNIIVITIILAFTLSLFRTFSRGSLLWCLFFFSLKESPFWHQKIV